MSAVASYADDGSSTESEDESYFIPDAQARQESPAPVAAPAVAATPASGSNNIMDIWALGIAPPPPFSAKEEADAVGASIATHIAAVAMPPEPEVIDLTAEEEPVKPETAAALSKCSSCGYLLLVVPQREMLYAKERLDCKCCLLILPASSFSKTQRNGGHKCKACTGNAFRDQMPRAKPNAASTRTHLWGTGKKMTKENTKVFTNKVGRLKCARRALERKRGDVYKLRGSTREDYERQLDNEQKALEHTAALLKAENSEMYKQLQGEIVVKRPLGIPASERDHPPKKRAKTAAQKKKHQEAKLAERRKKKAEKRKKMAEKRKQARKTWKEPTVDSSTYVPPASKAQEVVPARTIPTRSRTRAQLRQQQIKAAVISEMKSERSSELA